MTKYLPNAVCVNGEWFSAGLVDVESYPQLSPYCETYTPHTHRFERTGTMSKITRTRSNVCRDCGFEQTQMTGTELVRREREVTETYGYEVLRLRRRQMEHEMMNAMRRSGKTETVMNALRWAVESRPLGEVVYPTTELWEMMQRVNKRHRGDGAGGFIGVSE